MGTRHRVGNGVDNDRARIQVGEGADGGGGGFPLVPYHPDTDASRAFLLAYSGIE